MAVTQAQALELLQKYGDVLGHLEEQVDACGGHIYGVPDAEVIFRQQVPKLVLRALNAIAHDITFRPTLLDERSHSPALRRAFVKGDFGTPPDPNVCLRNIFANIRDTYSESTFKQLSDAFLQEDSQERLEAFRKEIVKLAFTADAPEGKVNLFLLRRLKKRLSPEHLNTYFSAMSELLSYATSDVEREAMNQDITAFQGIGNEMLQCVKAIENMHNTGEVNKKEIQKRLKILGENIEDALMYLDNTYNFSLEGQANIKPGQEAGERGLWTIFCYNFTCLLRIIFTILSIGYFKHENPLAKKLGYGTFFIKTGMTGDEKKDVETQQEKIKVLEGMFTKTQKTLASLTREIALLDNPPEVKA